ncbi:pyrroloquinoline quinone biosynthesis protein PqqE [uncultured Clostridium sp.]|nr:pyrroloquinoline quinone biosynthesis protein PqqE [uncultured Clostridium sp.]
MQSPQVKHLYSGGVITNYYCSSKCKHCSVASSPSWAKDYMTRDMARKILRRMRGMGCDSIHVGGGEPMLNFEGLKAFLEEARDAGVMIEYIESNSSWYRNEADALQKLHTLQTLGVDTLLISMSPFHNEYIPFQKVHDVMAACRKAGMRVFPWISEYFSDINQLDVCKTHTLAEYDAHFGRHFIDDMPRQWIGFTGRAAQFYKTRLALTPLSQILKKAGPCHKPYQTGHFHIDLYGNYLGCQGLAIALEDLGKPLDEEKYPYSTLLYQKGVGALLEAAQAKGYQPEKGYLSACHLCIELRRFLSGKLGEESRELQPTGYYTKV